MHCSWCKNRLSSLLRWIVKILCSERWTIDHQNVVVNGEQANNISSLSHTHSFSSRLGSVWLFQKYSGPSSSRSCSYLWKRAATDQLRYSRPFAQWASSRAHSRQHTVSSEKNTPHIQATPPLSPYDPRSSNQLHQPPFQITHTKYTNPQCFKMVYESDFYTTRRPYSSRPVVSSYTVTVRTPQTTIPHHPMADFTNISNVMRTTLACVFVSTFVCLCFAICRCVSISHF